MATTFLKLTRPSMRKLLPGEKLTELPDGPVSTSAAARAGHTLLRKPVKPAALRALVNCVLSRRSAA